MLSADRIVTCYRCMASVVFDTDGNGALVERGTPCGCLPEAEPAHVCARCGKPFPEDANKRRKRCTPCNKEWRRERWRELNGKNGRR